MHAPVVQRKHRDSGYSDLELGWQANPRFNLVILLQFEERSKVLETESHARGNGLARVSTEELQNRAQTRFQALLGRTKVPQQESKTHALTMSFLSLQIRMKSRNSACVKSCVSSTKTLSMCGPL